VGPSHIGSKDQYNNKKIRPKDEGQKVKQIRRIKPFGFQEKGTNSGVNCSSDLIVKTFRTFENITFE
jgi:hypothetical protein